MAQTILLKPAAEAIEQLNAKAMELDDLQRRCDDHGAIQRNLDLFAKWKAKMDFLLPNLFQDGTAASNALKHRRDTPVFYAAGEYEDGELIAEVKSYSFNLAALIEAIPFMRVAESAKAGRSGKGKAGPSNNTPIKIFISHSAKDEAFAKAIVDLLEGSLNVGDDAIRCTSVPGHMLKPGDDTAKTLRAEIEACDVLIALLTSNSLASKFVLMELGGAWVLNKPVCLVLHPSLKWGKLPGPFGSLHGVKADDRNGLISVVEVVKEATKFEPRSREKGDACLTNTLATLAKLFP